MSIFRVSSAALVDRIAAAIAPTICSIDSYGDQPAIYRCTYAAQLWLSAVRNLPNSAVPHLPTAPGSLLYAFDMPTGWRKVRGPVYISVGIGIQVCGATATALLQ